MPTQNEIRQTITNKIVESLKQGRIPWRKPWSGVEGPMTPTNFVSKHRYSGINIPILWLAAQERGFEVDYWGSFQQWKSIGASVKKGEKSSQIVFFKPIRKTVKADDGSEHLESFPLLRTFPVFNIHQVEGTVIEPILNRPPKSIFEDADRTEFDRLVEATKADIRYGGSRALYFRLPADYIQVPHEEHFHSFEAFAETIGHELSHWSEHRIGWSGSYSEGELRAELTAVFLMAAIGLSDSNDLTNHAAYLQSWLAALQNDPKFLFRAAAAASKSADFLLSFSRPQEAEADQVAEAA